MGREGFLARFIGRFPRIVELPVVYPRLEEERNMLNQNAERYNSAVERLSGLPPEALQDVRIAIRAMTAVQRIEDDILWRHALLKGNISPTKIQELSDLKDRADTNVEIEAPKFP